MYAGAALGVFFPWIVGRFDIEKLFMLLSEDCFYIGHSARLLTYRHLFKVILYSLNFEGELLQLVQVWVELELVHFIDDFYAHVLLSLPIVCSWLTCWLSTF